MRIEPVRSALLILALGCGAASLMGCGDSAAGAPVASTVGPALPGGGDPAPGAPAAPVAENASEGEGDSSGLGGTTEEGPAIAGLMGGTPTNGGPIVAEPGAKPADARSATLEVSPARVLLTGVRGQATPVVRAQAKLHNSGATALTVTQITLSGRDAKLFELADVPALPVELAAGAEASVAIALLTNGGLPPAPPQNDGGTALTANLEVSFAGGAAQAIVAGLVLTTATHEPTLGQILDAAGFPLDVGRAQNNANPNTGSTATLPGVEAGTDEIAAGLFQKASPGEVTVRVVARFSPKGPMPFGWYPRGAPQTRNEVATMASAPDSQSSDKARMLAPPVTGAPSFDPGDQVFGIWVYTDQRSQRFDVGGSAANGDYNYSEDAPNSPANVHRTKVYALKGADNAPIENSYLLAIEEAANGDYQDYVLVLGNVTLAP